MNRAIDIRMDGGENIVEKSEIIGEEAISARADVYIPIWAR